MGGWGIHAVVPEHKLQGGRLQAVLVDGGPRAVGVEVFHEGILQQCGGHIEPAGQAWAAAYCQQTAPHKALQQGRSLSVGRPPSELQMSSGCSSSQAPPACCLLSCLLSGLVTVPGWREVRLSQAQGWIGSCKQLTTDGARAQQGFESRVPLASKGAEGSSSARGILVTVP